MNTPKRRRDYVSNSRKLWRKRIGCEWCGGETDKGHGPMDYCSDACVQADMAGVEDDPPVILLADTDPAYVARKWSGS